MMTKKRPVWLLLDSRSFGGIETHVFQLASSLHKHHIAVEVLFMTDYGTHPLMPLFHRNNIKFRVLRHGLCSLIYALKQEQPIIVHTHGYKTGIYARIAHFFTKSTIVSTFHAGEKSSGKLAVYDLVDRMSACLSHALITVSAAINSRLDHQATIVDNFVAIEPQTFPGEQIAFVGRLSYEKGPDTFLKLATYFSNQQFHFYGEGPMQQNLMAAAGDNIVFHGHQASMDQQWQNIGLLVMPSRHEGLPLAAIEAMARGIPVCSFNVGALNRLIDQHCGWLAPPGNVNALRYGICQWLSGSLKHNLLISRNARKKIIVKFSDTVAIPIIINCYNQALANNHCGHQKLHSHLKGLSHDTD